MKITIEISEDDAACIWSNHHGERDGAKLEAIVAGLCQDEARAFKRHFTKAVAFAVESFLKAHLTESQTTE